MALFLDGAVLDTKCIFTIPLGTVTPAATGAATVANTTVTLASGSPALKSTDVLVALPASAPGQALGIAATTFQNATQVNIALINPTAGSLTWPAMTWTLVVFRP